MGYCNSKCQCSIPNHCNHQKMCHRMNHRQAVGNVSLVELLGIGYHCIAAVRGFGGRSPPISISLHTMYFFIFLFPNVSDERDMDISINWNRLRDGMDAINAASIPSRNRLQLMLVGITTVWCSGVEQKNEKIHCVQRNALRGLSGASPLSATEVQ